MKKNTKEFVTAVVEENGGEGEEGKVEKSKKIIIIKGWEGKDVRFQLSNVGGNWEG